MQRIVFILLLVSAHITSSFSQGFFRIKADFSVKETLPQGKSRLVIGKVYYDKNYKKILYDISFPEKEKILIDDSLLVKIIPGKPPEKSRVPSTNEFSIFHLSLNSNLADFGLKNSPYKIEKVEKENDMVISTYSAGGQYAGKLGKVMLSQKEKKLFGLVIFNREDEISGKQFFKNYSNVKGLEFPCEIIQINYAGGEEFYKVTTFRNIAVDEMRDENFYNFQVPE